jgi:hypothetical protein
MCCCPFMQLSSANGRPASSRGAELQVQQSCQQLRNAAVPPPLREARPHLLAVGVNSACPEGHPVGGKGGGVALHITLQGGCRAFRQSLCWYGRAHHTQNHTQHEHFEAARTRGGQAGSGSRQTACRAPSPALMASAAGPGIPGSAPGAAAGAMSCAMRGPASASAPGAAARWAPLGVQIRSCH